MSDAERRLRAEVDRLLPSAGSFAPSWSDVVSRSVRPRSSSRRRWLTLLVAISVAATSVGIAYGAAVLLTRGPDQILTVVSGSDWSLTAHRENGRLCLSYGAPGVEADGCRVGTHDALSLFVIAPAGRGRVRAIGTVAPGVERIEARVRGRRPIQARISPLPAVFASPLRVFVVNVPAPEGSLAAYDRHDRVVGRLPL